MSWRDLIALPRRVAEIHNQMGTLMSDVSPILTDLAAKLRALGPAVQAVAAENTRLAAENAQLRADAGETAAADAREDSAAADLVAAYNEAAGVLTAEPSAPDVEPLPEPEQPGSDEPAPAPAE